MLSTAAAVSESVSQRLTFNILVHFMMNKASKQQIRQRTTRKRCNFTVSAVFLK